MRIVGFGTYDRDNHPRAAILLDGLSQLGDEVAELNVTLDLSTEQRVAMLARPWLAYRLVLRLFQCWASLVGRRFRSWRSPDAVLVGYLGHFDVILARLLFPRTLIVLDLLVFATDTAVDRGVRSWLTLRLLHLVDLVAITCASLVMVSTEQDIWLLPKRYRAKAVVVPIGSPEEWFAEPADIPFDKGLRVVFFGTFSPLQGAPVIAEAISQLDPDTPVALTMIGTGQDFERTQRIVANDPRLTWIPWTTPSNLMALVREHHICLGVFGDTQKALRVTPNKVFQGAAAGCAIVTSDTAAQRDALGTAGIFVPPGDPAALAQVLRSLVDHPEEVSEQRALAYQIADQAYRPEVVAKPLREVLMRMLPRAVR